MGNRRSRNSRWQHNEKRACILVLLLVVVFVVSPALYAKGPGKVYAGKVVAIADGDTLTVVDNDYGEQHKIWLAGIDAPETNQAFGTKAREALAAKLLSKAVDVQVIASDRDGREIAYVYHYTDNLVPINIQMVREGLAWRYAQYDKRGAFTHAEKDAREHKRGLWSDPHPVPPWEFRKAKQSHTAPANR